MLLSQERRSSHTSSHCLEFATDLPVYVRRMDEFRQEAISYACKPSDSKGGYCGLSLLDTLWIILCSTRVEQSETSDALRGLPQDLECYITAHGQSYEHEFWRR
ncbi:hypothetical protein SAMN05216328_12638 [Ensifer sp. YR511]|nr:hypothetical protein SAMN05216328_12638 [Ensifer sp. YR511]